MSIFSVQMSIFAGPPCESGRKRYVEKVRVYDTRRCLRNDEPPECRGKKKLATNTDVVEKLASEDVRDACTAVPAPGIIHPQRTNTCFVSADALFWGCADVTFCGIVDCTIYKKIGMVSPERLPKAAVCRYLAFFPGESSSAAATAVLLYAGRGARLTSNI